MGQDSSKESEGGLQQYKLERNFDVDGVYQTFINAYCGELKLVQEFIDASPSNKQLIKTARDKRGRNLLMSVCAATNPKLYFSRRAENFLQKERARLEVVKYLLQPGLELFDINEVAPFIPRNETFDPRSNDPNDVFNLLGNDLTALGFACCYKTQNADLIETLLLEGANPNQESPSGKVTPLMLASAAQFPKAVAELLATNKVNPSGAESIAGYTPLHLLALNGSPSCENRTKQEDAVACAELLIAAGADIEARNGTIDTPLLSAVLYAPLEADSLVRYFIRAGCDVFDFGFAIHNRLMEFHVGRSESKLLKLFDHQDSGNDVKVFSTIISKEATKKIRTSKKNRLCEAILLGSIGVVECVLAGGVSVNAICEIVPGVKVTPLQLACSVYPNTSPAGVSDVKDFPPDDDTLAVEMTRLLLKAGAKVDFTPETDPNAINPFTNFPPLFIAAANRVDSRSLVKLLVEQGKANVEFDSLTPLHMAVRYNNYFVCEYFVNTLKIIPSSHEQYQRLQEFIHVTETNLANDVIDATRIISTEDRQKLKNNHRNKSLLSFDVPLSSTELVRPFERDADAPEYDQINLKFISLLLPPKTVEQEAVVAPLHFHPQLFSLQIENDLATNTSKVVIGPSPRSSVVSLAPCDRAKRIAFGLSPLNTEHVKVTAENEIDRVCDFPGMYDGYEDGRLRELMASHNAQTEPTSDECFIFKLKQLENPPPEEPVERSKLTQDQKKDAFFARVFNFYQKYDPSKIKDESWQARLESIYYGIGGDALIMKLEAKYGPEPPFRFTLAKPLASVPRTDPILSAQLTPQETIVSSAHRPNFGLHFPSTEIGTHRTDQFFLHEFRLLIEKFEPERGSRALLHAYIIVMHNVGSNCDLFEIYCRMWKQYNHNIISTPASVENFAFTHTPAAAGDNNNDNRNCSYLLPLVERIHLKAGGFTHDFAQQWKQGLGRSGSLRRLWSHLGSVTSARMVEPCVYELPSWMDGSWKARLTAFYKKYNPEKLSTVESTLEKFKGQEKELMEALAQKYGPEPYSILSWVNDESSNNNKKMFDPFTFESDESTSSWSSSSPPISDAFRRRATEYVRSNNRASTDLPLLDSILPQFVGNEFTFLKNYSVTRLGLVNGAKQVFTAPFTKRSFRIPYSCHKAASSLGVMLRVAPDALKQKDRVAAFLQLYAPEKMNNFESVMKNMKVTESQVLGAVISIYGPEPPEYVVPFAVANSNQEPDRASSSSADYRSRLERFYQKYVPEKVSNVDATLEKFAGKEEELFKALTAKYGSEPEKSWPTISIFTNSGMSLDARLTSIVKYLPSSISAHFGFTGKPAGEIVGLLKSGSTELRNICEGALTDADATRETTCDVEFIDDDDSVVTFACLKYCVDEPKPVAPPLRNFLLPRLELICKEGVILDVKMELLANAEAGAVGGGIDNLVIEIKALIRQNPVATKKCGDIPEKNQFVVERKFQFVACDVGVENNQSVQQNNVDDDDLTREFSL